MKYTKMLGWLVMAAALSFTGCSSEDNLAQEPTTQQPTETATKIHVSVGAGIDNATTRSAVDYTNGVRTLQFTTGDKLYVWGGYGNMKEEQSGTEYYPYIVLGYLDLDTQSFDPSAPTNATFTGDLTVYQWVNEVGHFEPEEIWVDEQGHQEQVGEDEDGPIYDWVIDVVGHNEIVGEQWWVEEYGYYTPASSSPSFSTTDPLSECNNVTGTLLHKDAVKDVNYFIYEGDRQVYFSPDCAATVDELMTSGLWVRGYYTPSTHNFTLAKVTAQPILNCTISGLEDGVNYKVDYIYGTTAAMSGHTKALFSSMTATGGTLSFAFIAETDEKFHGIRLTNTADANDTYTVSIGQKSFASKVYNLSRRFVNLSSLTENYTAQNGDILTGTLANNVQVSIANGATVTLDGVNITNLGKGCFYAGITCIGDATILLSGSNYVMGGMDDSTQGVGDGYGIYPSIFVPTDKTLTIDGTGSLDARSNGSDEYSKYAPGIGGDSNNGCGNIVIQGGSVTATGGNNCPGIGGNSYGGGYITITGSANVTATGGYHAAGIGSGYHASCGNITISTTGTVMAQGGSNGAGIGSGNGYPNPSQCGNILISKGTIVATGGDHAAGIGSGKQSTCGTITIENTVTSVTATNGYDAFRESIGRGNDGTCGTVTIGGTMYWGLIEGSSTKYEYKNSGGTYLTQSPLVYQP